MRTTQPRLVSIHFVEGISLLENARVQLPTLSRVGLIRCGEYNYQMQTYWRSSTGRSDVSDTIIKCSVIGKVQLGVDISTIGTVLE
jgi:hypothetical protein